VFFNFILYDRFRMIRQEWISKFEYNHILLDTMIQAIPNFEKHNEKFIIKKALKYYSQINTGSILVLKNRTMPEMRTSTYLIEQKIGTAKELLRIELEKRKIPNEWDPKLPNLGTD
jgi:hypothetical protein